ncbi:hypothetical protein INR49_030313, partial [Caranx melampygus]
STVFVRKAVPAQLLCKPARGAESHQRRLLPRCLLVNAAEGNCGCGTHNWNHDCTCQAAKTTLKLHEVLKYAPEVTLHQRHRRPQVRWVIDEIFLTHHEACEPRSPDRSM